MRDVPSVAYTSAKLFTVSDSTDQSSPSMLYPQLYPQSSPPMLYPQFHNQSYTAKYDHQGPSDVVGFLAINMDTQGAVLPVTPPAPNSHWNITFFGPSIRCRNVSDGLRNVVSLDIASSINESMWLAHPGGDGSTTSGSQNTYLNPLYFARTPSMPSDISPDDPSFEGYVRPLHRNTSEEYEIGIRSTGDMVPLYVGVIPSVNNLTLQVDVGGSNPFMAATLNWNPDASLTQMVEDYIEPGLTLLQCDLHNSTYDLSYNFSAGIQTVESTISMLADEPFRFIDLALGFTPADDYEAFVPAPEVGEDLPAPADCQGLWSGLLGTNTTCAFDANVLVAFSYKAVWDAFNDLVRGGLYIDATTHAPARFEDTHILNTLFARSTELEPIVRIFRGKGGESLDRYGNAPDMNATPLDQYSNVPGMYATPKKASTSSLSSLLEEFFSNFTINLASLSELQ
jgi:hypothetical protein